MDNLISIIFIIMKYIISESRLHDFMTSYLNSFLGEKIVSHVEDYIIISNHVDSEEWEDIMEFDRNVGRLWVNHDFLRQFDDLFGRGPKESMMFITNWFENHFDVKSKYQKSKYL